MKILSGEAKHEFILEFPNEQEFGSFLEEIDQEGVFLIQHQNIPENATFRATAVGSLRSRRIRPILIIKDGDDIRVTVAEKKEQNLAPEGEEASEEKRELAKTVAEQVRSLTVTEKAMLAMRANLAERRVLMQDNNPKIQEFLLRNPRLTEPEIAFLAKNPLSAIPTLLTIIRHKEWMGTDSIRQGILTNPKTPAHIILDKIPTLSAGDLIKMHHAKNLRADIRDEVDRQMKKRGIRIRSTDV